MTVPCGVCVGRGWHDHAVRNVKGYVIHRGPRMCLPCAGTGTVSVPEIEGQESLDF